MRRTYAGFFLAQTKYITELVRRANMENSKPVATTMASNFVSDISESPLFSDPFKYRSIVGGLQYLAFTSPDISFAVN